MNTIASYTDTSSILAILNRCYPVRVDQLTLHRDMIGRVYIATGGSNRYILKLYRSFDTDNALRSVGIIEYLRICGYPVVPIIPTAHGTRYITIETPEGSSTAILFDFVEGAEPVIEHEIEGIGRQAGLLHRLMDAYPESLISHGKDFYVDRYLAILQELHYPASRIDALAAYGAERWSRLEQLPRGFCHGDLHTGNMRHTGPCRYVLFDFDAASRTCSTVDVATVCDGSNFNRFDDSAYDRTLRRFERFYQGYRQERELTGAEIAGIFDFIPIRHYEIIATITQCQGLEELSRAFLDEQYDWLLRWQAMCERRAGHLA